MSRSSIPRPDPMAREHAIRTTVAAYDDRLVRTYCHIRFRILHRRFLDELLQFLPAEGRVLEVGCGFGLFALYFSQLRPGLKIEGFDLSAHRIALAERAQARLKLEHPRFFVGDARSLPVHGPFHAIYMLDILHHLPPDLAPVLIRTLYDQLVPGGVLLIKDVDTWPTRKRWFTWALDVAMTRGELPHYFSAEEVLGLVREVGFQVFSHDMVDLLPYPHRLYFCLKGGLDHLSGA